MLPEREGLLSELGSWGAGCGGGGELGWESQGLSSSSSSATNWQWESKNSQGMGKKRSNCQVPCKGEQ